LGKEKKVDFFIGLNPYDNWMIPTISFYEIKSSFFNLSKNDFQINDKKNLIIGIACQDYQEIILQNYPDAKIIIYDDYDALINALENNTVDLIYDDKLAIEFFTLRNNLFHLIKPLNNMIINNKVEGITYDKNKADLFNQGFLKIPIKELLETENKWIINEHEKYYLNYKQPILLTEKEKEFLNKNKLKISVSQAWEPFVFKSINNEAIGISTDYWKLIADKLNLNYENIFTETFSQQLDDIKNKKADIIYSTGETSNRKEYSVFTKEYAKFPISIVTKKDENFIENISLLNNKKIAIGNNFTAHNIIKDKYPNMNFILVDSVKEGLELVSNNKAYAFIDIQPVLFYNITKYDFTDLKISGNTGLDFSLKFMIRDDYAILEPILDKAISSISINELNEILNKWNNVQFQTSLNYEWFWQILAIIAIIILAFVYRTLTLNHLNKTLKIKVNEKTKELNEMNKNLEKLVKEKTKELIQKEKILNHQSKMAAMGEMLENIAHQWRQPLSLISTAATGAKIKKDFGTLSDNDFYETMDMINNSTQHLSTTIDDFRNFFNNDKDVSNFNINQPIEKVLSLINSKLKNRNINVIKNTQDVEVTALINEFIQVLINIINNSLDAFEEHNLEKKFIFIDLYKDNNSLILKIKDNAGGIKEELLNRIFEPYFTTKHKSQGTGIGLYMSMEIIKKHMNGDINVSNEEYIYDNIKCKGAQFKIEIPIKE
jgi:signal transduction histidine kinase